MLSDSMPIPSASATAARSTRSRVSGVRGPGAASFRGVIQVLPAVGLGKLTS
jgi:hypothetical protein